MNITDVDNLNWRSFGRSWTSNSFWLWLWEGNREIGDGRDIAKPKEGVAKQCRRPSGNNHIAESGGKDGSFEAHESGTHIGSIKLQFILEMSHICKGIAGHKH